jgi:hypothetical protein
MGEWSSQIIAMLKDRAETEADSLGLDMVADIRANISTPVVRGPLGGVIRSRPYEYPFKEKGLLWMSERHHVGTNGTVVELDIINDAPYARRLHDGHGNVEPRPFHDLARYEWAPQIPHRIIEAIAGRR